MNKMYYLEVAHEGDPRRGGQPQSQASHVGFRVAVQVPDLLVPDHHNQHALGSERGGGGRCRRWVVISKDRL